MKEIKFINDKVIKKILTSERRENREYLIRIISATTNIDINLLRDNIELVTNEVSSNVNVVDSTVDTIYKDNNKYFNIEINYNNSNIVTVKNNIYLYNMILRQVRKSNEYKEVLPAIQININNYDMFKKGEFIYKSKMIDMKYHKVRDEMITIYDINLEYLREIDYNEIKKGNNYNLEKILYIFICNNKKELDYIYNGDDVMDKVRENFDSVVSELDEMLYYNPEDINRQIIEYETEQARKKGREEGIKEGIKEGREQGKKDGITEGKNQKEKEIIENMLKSNISDDIILSSINISKEYLEAMKKSLSD